MFPEASIPVLTLLQSLDFRGGVDPEDSEFNENERGYLISMMKVHELYPWCLGPAPSDADAPPTTTPNHVVFTILFNVSVNNNTRTLRKKTTTTVGKYIAKLKPAQIRGVSLANQPQAPDLFTVRPTPARISNLDPTKPDKAVASAFHLAITTDKTISMLNRVTTFIVLWEFSCRVVNQSLPFYDDATLRKMWAAAGQSVRHEARAAPPCYDVVPAPVARASTVSPVAPGSTLVDAAPVAVSAVVRAARVDGSASVTHASTSLPTTRYARVYAQVYVYVNVCVCAYECVCMCIRMCVYMYINMVTCMYAQKTIDQCTNTKLHINQSMYSLFSTLCQKSINVF
jgi:hypothetical protein